jgi:hypothetical protein
LSSEVYSASNFRAICTLEGNYSKSFTVGRLARVYPKVFGLAAWSENCKWYSSLPLGAVVLVF